MNVTIKDVANKVGVSPSTVSKVINKSPTISQPTIDRVEAAMKELNYYPNIQARNFAKQTTNTIIFLVKTEPNIAFTNPHMFQIMCGTTDFFSSKGYNVNFVCVENIEDAPSLLEKIIVQRSADGVIAHGSVTSKALAELLVKMEFPHIFIGKPNFHTSACWIDINNHISGQIACKHLLECDIKKIAFIGGRMEDEISSKRLNGFLDVCKSYDISIPEHYIKCNDNSKYTDYDLACELLDSDDCPDAIICESNNVAFAVERAVTERRLSVPEDISLISFDNYPLSQLFDPPLTVVDIDVHDMGVQAAEALFKKIKNPLMQIQVYTTSPSLIIRDSTRRKTSSELI